MCNPMLAVMAVSAVISLGTAAAGAQQQREAGRESQAIAESNAKAAEVQARDAQIQGAQEAQQSIWKTRAAIATQKASAASANVDITQGSAFDIIGDTALFGSIDRQNIELNASRKAWGFGAQATNYRNEGALANWKGKTGAGITLLSGLGQAVGSFQGGYFGAGPGKG